MARLWAKPYVNAFPIPLAMDRYPKAMQPSEQVCTLSIA
jgi:hypothetical protein